jgi:plastocyanin
VVGFVKTLLLVASVLMALSPALASPGEGEHEESMGGIRSPDLAPGEAWSYTFTEPQTFDYHCHPHPWMVAGIQVMPSSGRAPLNHTVDVIEPEGQDFEAWDWSPSPLTIEVGDTVTWVNKGSVMHVVQQTTEEHAAHIGSETESKATDDGHLHTEGATSGKAGWWILGILVGGLALVYKGSPRPNTATPTQEAVPVPVTAEATTTSGDE